MYAVEGEMRRGEDRDRKDLIARKRDTDREEEDSRHHRHSWLSARTSLIPSRTPIQSDTTHSARRTQLEGSSYSAEHDRRELPRLSRPCVMHAGKLHITRRDFQHRVTLTIKHTSVLVRLASRAGTVRKHRHHQLKA